MPIYYLKSLDQYGYLIPDTSIRRSGLDYIFVAPPVAEVDPYTKLLLHGFSYNDSTNIIDSSPYPKVITFNGNSNISTTQSKFIGKSSIYFDGNGDYLTIQDGSYWNLSTNNFCLECFLKSSTSHSSPKYLLYLQNTSGTEYFSVSLNNRYNVGGPDYGIIIGINAQWMGVGSISTLTDTNWHHIVITRNNNVISVYVDGILGNSINFSNPINLQGGNKIFGGYAPSSPQLSLDGNLCDIKLSVGVPRYIENFDVPSIPFTDYSTGNDGYTSLLIHGNSANNGSTLIQDYSNYKKTITINGNTVISTAQSKFGNGSIYFDGSSQLTLADSPEWDFEGAFTIDAHVYRTGTYIYIFGSNPGSSQPAVTKPTYFFYGTVSELSFGYTTGFGSWPIYITYNGGIPQNEWHHVAIVRTESNDIFLFLDGQIVGTSNYVGTITNAYNGMFVGGCTNSSTINSTGYMSEIRVDKGIARWTENFDVPTAPYHGPEWNGIDEYTKLLLHFDGENGQTTTIDSSQYNNTVTLSGNAVLDTTQKQYGASSLLLDGNGDYVSIPNSDRWDFNNDFTVELYVRFISSPNSKGLIGHGGDKNTGGDPGWMIFITGGGKFYFAMYDDSLTQVAYIDSGLVATTDIWYHVAIVRNGNTITLYVNGIAKSTCEYGSVIDFGTAPLLIGCRADITNLLNGNIDEVRILNGYAKYTQNFPVPYRPVGN